MDNGHAAPGQAVTGQAAPRAADPGNRMHGSDAPATLALLRSQKLRAAHAGMKAPHGDKRASRMPNTFQYWAYRDR